MSNKRVIPILFVLIIVFLGGFVTIGEAGLFGLGGDSRPERNVASFESVGREWGKKLRGKKPGDLPDEAFVSALISRENIDYFNVHSDLKDAFKKGFRLGFEDRIADLVLGPHLSKAAERIGFDTSSRFVNVITVFEEGWASTLKNAVEVFIVLISEGSQADREAFIRQFTSIYTDKFNKTEEILKGRKFMAQVSDGGTLLYLDYSKGKTLGALEIPRPAALKSEIYRQTFKVMGDEWGRRYRNNLIKREELIDLLRRMRPALQETPEDEKSLSARLNSNLGIIYGAFIDSYEVEAEKVFMSLLRAAEYSETPVPRRLYEPPQSTIIEPDKSHTEAPVNRSTTSSKKGRK